MKLYNLKDIVLDGSTSQMIDEVHAELEVFTKLGDFTPEINAELAKVFLPDRISDTLNIEGVRVNPRLTRAVLDGLAVAETDRYTGQEILNVNEANELITHEAKNSEKLTPDLIKEIHRRVEKNLIKEIGTYRSSQVTITGAKHFPPAWADVPEFVRQICEQIDSGDSEPVLTSIWAHASLTKVHPFLDGNGRTARMVQDFILLRAKLLPVGIPISRRSEYYEALEQADEGIFSPLAGIVASAELAALDKARRVADAPRQRRARIKKLIKAASQTTRQNEYNQYEVWRRKTEGFVSEFVRWLDDLNSEAEEFQFRYRTYETKSFEKWRDIRSAGWAHGTRLLLIDVTVRGRMMHKFLFYVKRHKLNWTMDPDDHLRNEVGIFIDEVDASESRFNLTRIDDPYISLREIVFDGNHVLVYRSEQPSEDDPNFPDGVTTNLEKVRWESRNDMSLSDVIEEFIEQVLTKLGLIDS